MAGVSALEIADEVSKNLQEEGTRQEQANRYYTDGGRQPGMLPANAAAAIQRPLPHPVASTAQAPPPPPPPTQPPQPPAAGGGSSPSGLAAPGNAPRRPDDMPVTTQGPPGPPGPPGAPGAVTVVPIPTAPNLQGIVNPTVSQIEQHLRREHDRAKEARLNTLEAEATRISEESGRQREIQRTAAEVAV